MMNVESKRRRPESIQLAPAISPHRTAAPSSTCWPRPHAVPGPSRTGIPLSGRAPASISTFQIVAQNGGPSQTTIDFTRHSQVYATMDATAGTCSVHTAIISPHSFFCSFNPAGEVEKGEGLATPSLARTDEIRTKGRRREAGRTV